MEDVEENKEVEISQASPLLSPWKSLKVPRVELEEEETSDADIQVSSLTVLLMRSNQEQQAQRLRQLSTEESEPPEKLRELFDVKECTVDLTEDDSVVLIEPN